jgi:hypothetical protein
MEQQSRQVQIWSRWAKSRDVRLLNLFPPFASSDPTEMIRRYYITATCTGTRRAMT